MLDGNVDLAPESSLVMTNVSRTNRNGQRPKSDLYPTPPECTAALVQAMPEVFKRGARIWEPACGDGAIVRVLQGYGCQVFAFDKFNHGPVNRRSCGGRDFFAEKKLLAPIIVTNCPYNVADEFVGHALSLHPQLAFFFLPITFLAGTGRTALIEDAGLHTVFVLRNRVTLSPKHLGLTKGGVVTYAWFMWKRGFGGLPTIRRITARIDPELERRKPELRVVI